MTTPTELLSAALRSDGSRPLLTYYDDATGERVELSVATTANWVAKTTSFLVDEHGVHDGDAVSIQLPLHWQTAVLLLATWAAGAQAGFDPGGVVTFTTAASTDPTVLTLALGPMGADFSRLVAAQPDSYVPFAPTGEDVVDAAPVDLPNGARVLTVLPYDAPSAIGYGLIAPLAVEGSIIMIRNGSEAAKLAAHAASERATHTLGVDIDGLPRLDA